MVNPSSLVACFVAYNLIDSLVTLVSISLRFSTAAFDQGRGCVELSHADVIAEEALEKVRFVLSLVPVLIISLIFCGDRAALRAAPVNQMTTLVAITVAQAARFVIAVAWCVLQGGSTESASKLAATTVETLLIIPMP